MLLKAAAGSVNDMYEAGKKPVCPLARPYLKERNVKKRRGREKTNKKNEEFTGHEKTMN